MFTNCSTWLLKPYISFQFRKSSIKKLYQYHRTRKTGKFKRFKATGPPKQSLAAKPKIDIKIDEDNSPKEESFLPDKDNDTSLKFTDSEISVRKDMPKVTLFNTEMVQNQTDI